MPDTNIKSLVDDDAEKQRNYMRENVDKFAEFCNQQNISGVMVLAIVEPPAGRDHDLVRSFHYVMPHGVRVLTMSGAALNIARDLAEHVEEEHFDGWDTDDPGNVVALKGEGPDQ